MGVLDDVSSVLDALIISTEDSVTVPLDLDAFAQTSEQWFYCCTTSQHPDFLDEENSDIKAAYRDTAMENVSGISRSGFVTGVGTTQDKVDIYCEGAAREHSRRKVAGRAVGLKVAP